MNRLLTLLIVVTTMLALPARAQFTVEDQTKNRTAGNVNHQTQIQNANINELSSFSEARDRLERQRIRKERNYLEVTLKLQGTMTSYNEAWADTKGGDNAISVLGSFNLVHTYKKNLFSNNTQVSAKYGYNRLRVDTEEGDRKGVWFKNIDEFWLQVQPKMAMNKTWSYTMMFKF